MFEYESQCMSMDSRRTLESTLSFHHESKQANMLSP